MIDGWELRFRTRAAHPGGGSGPGFGAPGPGGPAGNGTGLGGGGGGVPGSSSGVEFRGRSSGDRGRNLRCRRPPAQIRT